MAKKKTAFSLSDEALELLDLISKKHIRSATNMMEVLIIQEAERLGIKLSPAKKTKN